MRKRSSGIKVNDLAVLAGSVGLVEKSDDGKQAFLAWYANDQKACRKALFARVEARRVAASATAAAAATSGSTSAEYPASWARRVLSATSGVRVQRGQR